jgi:hypothetical protein
MDRSILVAAVALSLLAMVSGCDRQPSSPTSPSAVAASSGGGLTLSASPGSLSGATDVTFPPRNEPFDFRLQLETKYRDGLRRGAGTSFVDIEGDIVWVQEYLRYRVNLCDHATAIQKVFLQIDGAGVQPTCGNAPSGNVLFPPRNEPFDFRVQLEAKYRDGLRRGPTTTHVDIEGDIVWIQEYLRYRVNNCGHQDAVMRVFTQLDGGGVQPTCAPVVEVTPPPVADFTVTPLPGTGVTASGSCGVVSVSGPNNQLRCRFDAGSSSGRITSYRWDLPGGVAYSGQAIQDVTVPCNALGSEGGATPRTVSLTVTGPGGSNTRSRSVTFVKSTFC